MVINVILVDDSAIVRGLIKRTLGSDPDIKVVAMASNGRMAIDLAREHRPDIIILDIEMPEMDGITALPGLLEAAPSAKIIMASTLTLRNADISIKALTLGASDYIAKPSVGNSGELAAFYRELSQKIHALAGARKKNYNNLPNIAKPLAQSIVPVKNNWTHAPISVRSPIKALAIACSTGGPQALITLFKGLKGKIQNTPIFLTQHMPPTFTTILAQHLAKDGERACMEAKSGDMVEPGKTYVAPGDYHMLAFRENENVVIRLNQNPPVNFCRPAADPMLESLSLVYGKHLMVVVLTGMGQDGLVGAKTVADAGGSIIAQDEATSIVWGMPGAVATHNLCQAVLPIQDIAEYISQRIGT